jgi:predicted transcriptional regulator
MKILPIIVSHRAMDIGTDIRNLESVVFVDKPSKERAVFYGESDGDELKNKMLDISGYSTDERYTYESDDLFISWKWDGLDDIVELMENPQQFKSLWEEKGVVKDLKGVARDIENTGDLESKRDGLIREVASLGYSQSEIAEFAGVSPSRVSRLLSEDGDDDSDGGDSAGTASAGELTDGEIAAENEAILDELSDAQTEILRDAVQDELEDQ